ncbi:MAG: WbqC family protein [Alphaproteobacteria bacterium]
MTTVAIMQPYFIPYAGYFRLFAAADTVALLDCVQFPRRGWVHRNQLPDAGGQARWLTLPLTKAPQTARIAEMTLAADAPARLGEAMRRFPALGSVHPLHETVADAAGALVPYLERTLSLACTALGLPFRTIRTSGLQIGEDLRAEDRILAIAERLGATTYLNLAGGRGLYDPEHFAARGIALRFLDDWQGSYWSILHRLATEPATDIAADIRRQC